MSNGVLLPQQKPVAQAGLPTLPYLLHLKLVYPALTSAYFSNYITFESNSSDVDGVLVEAVSSVVVEESIGVGG